MDEIKWDVETGMTVEGDDGNVEVLIGNLEVAHVAPAIAQFESVFQSIEFEVKRKQYEAEAFEIARPEDRKEAVEKISWAKKVKKALETRRTEVQRKPQALIKMLGNHVIPITDLCEKIMGTLENKVKMHDARIEQKEKEINAEMQRKREELVKQLAAEAQATGTAPVTVPELVETKVDKTIRTASGVTGFYKTVVTVDIINPDLVPREYCSPDKKKILDAHKKGIEEIPGVKITVDKELQTRG